MSGNSITPLGDFGPAAKALVDRVSDAVGGVLRPWQTRRVARAEADGAKILAAADIEITDMRRRAVQRMLIEQERNQANIENVVRQELPHLDENAEPDKIDDDWMARFFEECRLVSNEEMQVLWGRILAGEANKTGAFSQRTLRVVSDLTRTDAEWFTELCRFGWYLETRFHPLVYDVGDAIYSDNRLSFGRLNHLDDIGLITFNNLSGFKRTGIGAQFRIWYCGVEHVVTYDNDSGNDFNCGKVLLSQPGFELATICNVEGVDDFPSYVAGKIATPQVGIACVLPEA